MFVKVLCCFVFLSQCVLSQDLMIGGVFYEDEAVDLRAALEIGVRNFNFTAKVMEISRPGETLEINQQLCELASEGVIGIIDGLGGRDSEHIQALCDIMDLPHVLIQPMDLYTRNWSAINMHPSDEAYNAVILDLITLKEWENFTIIYVKGRTTSRVSRLMEIGNITKRYSVSVREVHGDDYRTVLINAKQSGYYNFVVDCPSLNLEQLLIQAQQVGLMADEHSYIFVSPDLFTLDHSRYRYGGVNMTGFRFVPLQTTEPTAQEFWDFTSNFNTEKMAELTPEEIKTKVVITYDTVKVFYEGVNKMKQISTQKLSCEDDEAWPFGSSLLNFMKTNRVEGLTRSIIFNGLGMRTDVTFDILELTPAGNQTIGQWESNKLEIFRPMVASDIGDESIMKNKTFKVLISTTPPYGYIVESSQELEGNLRYEGFTVDLIVRLGEILGFNYEFEIENDYGSIDSSGKWTGMVIKLMEEKADFALCDFTITSQRQSAVDFSTPFMTTGISILYKKPSKQPPEMFSFMAVFAPEVWYYMLFVEMGVAVIMIFVGRISHKEWQNPVPCIEQPEELTNQFSFANSVWLIIGSVMQQGSEIAPIALAPRMITSVWWFFTMVMVASYVGTLVAVLTVEKNVYPFTNVEELYGLKSTSYGAKNRGSTIQFFQNSTHDIYQKMYRKMYDNKWLVKENEDGVALAELKSYAFFMEAATIQYYTERHCDLLQIGKLLDSKSYGIGMKKDSPYKKYIDNALLQLKESGELQKIRDLWWKEKRGGGKCGETGDEETKQLGMKNMMGAFVVLGAGCLIGLFISIGDMLWSVFKRSVKYSTSFKYELIEELKFALKFSGDIKPVKRPSDSEGSDEALANTEIEAEAKDELGSLHSKTKRSIRSRSTSTNRSSHSHSSRHSSGGLSIAFARRREYT